MFKDNIHTLESLKLKQCNLITHTVQNMIGLFSRIRIEAKQVLMFTVPYWQFMSHVR